MFLNIGEVDRKWNRRIEEKKSYWGDYGKLRGFTPGRAVYEAFLEIANELHSENHEKYGMEVTWKDLAYALAYASDWANDPGEFKTTEEILPPLWLNFYKQYRQEEAAKNVIKKKKHDEVASHKFTREQIENGWTMICEGNLPEEVKRIWRNSGPPRSSAHVIAEKAGVSIRDFVFWMVVFRQNGMMSEQMLYDEHLYCNEESWLLDREKLPDNLKSILKNLNADN